MMLTSSKRSAPIAMLAAIFLFLCFLREARAFIPNNNQLSVTKTTITLSRCVEFTGTASTKHPLLLERQTLFGTNDDVQEEEDTGFSLQFNPLYGALWLAFLTFGIFFSPGEMLDPKNTQIIEGFINDPSNACGTMNPLFFAVFNALGIMPIVMAQLALPQGSKGGVPVAPFVLGSFAAGFGAMGLYLTLRSPPVESKTKEEASWITGNVLDNKIANWGVVALCGSVLVTSGIVSSVADDSFGPIWEGYQQLASTSKLVSVSSVDLMTLTVAAATLIPQDYRLRNADSDDDDSNISLIAASTVLFPVVGAALYCALRPPLPEE